MEAFESFVALAMQSEGLVVTGPFKFKIGHLSTGPKPKGTQDTPYEIDLVGASGDRLVLATVKSYFGSTGVKAPEVMGIKGNTWHYRMLNDPIISQGLVAVAADFFGYKESQVEVRLYAGKYAGKNGEDQIREWASQQVLGGGPIGVFNIAEVVGSVRVQAQHTTYSDNPALVAMKAIRAERDYLAAQQLASAPKVSSKKQEVKVQIVRSWNEVERLFPLGTLVRSKKDGFEGVVIGYTNQGTPNAYVTILNEETGISKRRAAATLKIENSSFDDED